MNVTHHSSLITYYSSLNKMYLFFDTETTGLPLNYKAPLSQLNNWPRLVQLAWLVYNKEGDRISSKNYIIKPEGFTIPAGASNVHGITTERAMQEGLPLIEILNEFALAIHGAEFIIAHNIGFDEKIVGAEFLRKEISSLLFAKPRICTMVASTNYCQLPGQYGYKWPNLKELHIKLFGKGFDNAHDAANDIDATANCFWELKKRGIITHANPKVP